MSIIGPTLVEEAPDRLVVSPPPVPRRASVLMNLFLVVCCLGMWAGALFHWLGDGSRRSEPAGVSILFAALGVGMSLWALDTVFVRRCWVIWPASIARRTRLPLLGLVRERGYPGVQRIELRHGVWKSGHQDILRFRVWGRARPIELTGVSFQSSGSAPVQDQVDAELARLGEVIAARVGVPFERVEESIPDPTAD